MPDSPERGELHMECQNRRRFARKQVSALAYADLGEDNGGLVLDMSEGGMAIHAAVVLASDELPKIRFQLPRTREWLEASGKIVWAGKSRKLAGIEFLEIGAETREKLRAWLASGEDDANAPDETNREGAGELSPEPTIEIPPRLERPEPQQEVQKEPKTTTIQLKIGPPIAPPQNAPNGTAVPSAMSEPESIPGLAGSSIFGLRSVPSTEGRDETEARGPVRWGLLALVILLVGASFGSGMAIGRFGVDGVVSRVRSALAGRGAAISAAQIGGGASEAGRSGASSPNSAPRAASPDSSATPSGYLQASRKPRSQPQPPGSGTRSTAAPGSAGEPANANPQQPGSASDTPVESSLAEDGSESVLTFADTPVSASDAVAVSEKISVSVPVAAAEHPEKIKVARLVRRVDIAYPAAALEQNLQGIVRLQIAIARDGSVGEVSNVDGDSTLAKAASDAVRQWIFKPTTLAGQPIESKAVITVAFRPSQNTQ